jgi:hypothetical protein
MTAAKKVRPVDGCEGPVVARGWSGAHCQRSTA